MTEDQIEEMLAECMEEAEACPSAFTSWELEFLTDIEERNVDRHLTEDQISKLAQIHQERVCA